MRRLRTFSAPHLYPSDIKQNSHDTGRDGRVTTQVTTQIPRAQPPKLEARPFAKRGQGRVVLSGGEPHPSGEGVLVLAATHKNKNNKECQSSSTHPAHPYEITVTCCSRFWLSSGLGRFSTLRTELFQLLVIPSSAPHPIQTNRQSPRHGYFRDLSSSSHRQVEKLVAPSWFVAHRHLRGFH